MKSKTKLPYQGLALSSKGKQYSDLTRKIYLHELPLKRTAPTRSIESEEYRKYHSSSRNVAKDLHISLNRQMHRSNDKEHFSDRKNKDSKKSCLFNTGRPSKLSKNKFFTNSKIDRNAEKSTMISAGLSNHHQRQQKFKEDLRKHEEGKNCRVIVIDGTEEVEHFIEVNSMGDIMSYLRKEYPKTCYYRSVPVQYTLDYLLMQEAIPGQFLNGQSLYLKPAAKEHSFDEKESIGLEHF